METFCVRQLAARRHSDTWLDHILRLSLDIFQTRKDILFKHKLYYSSDASLSQIRLACFQIKWRKVYVSYWVGQMCMFFNIKSASLYDD